MDINLIERIHPAISSFPLAFVTLLFTVELLLNAPKRQVAVPILLSALGVSIVCTFFSGYVTEPFLAVEEPQEVVLLHHQWGRATLYAYGVVLSCWWWQRSGHRRLWRMFYLLALGISFITIGMASMKGGQLVFSHGIGIADNSHEQNSKKTRP